MDDTDLHSAQVLRSGHDVSASLYAGGIPPHKRLRKPIVRKSVDPNPTFINFVMHRKFFPSKVYKPHALPPHSYYKRQMLPPLAYPMNEDLSSCVCTKFCRCSTNKQRCPVNCVSWTPEGRRLITGNSVGEFTLWNGLAFNFETILQAHDDAVRAMVWSHNSNWLLTADHGGVLKYWQPSMSNVQLIQGHREAVRSLSFSPTDAKFVSCSDDATVKIWDFESGREERVLTGHGWDVKCVAYHPQKCLLASGSKDNLIKIWDPKTGNSLNTLHGHKNTVFKVAWNDNGNWLLTASRDQLIKIYDIRTLKEFATFKGHTREVTSIAWHPWYERLFVSGSYDGSLMYWEVGKEEALASIPQAHDAAVWDIQWHPVGHVVATGSNDHSTKFWSRNRPGDPMDDKYNGGQNVLKNETDTMMNEPFSEGGRAILAGMGDGVRPNAVNPTSSNANQSKYGNTPGPTRRPPPDSYTCNRCSTKGHWIDECPLKDQSQRGGGVNGTTGARIPPEGYLCKKCNTPGHYISDCTQTKAPPPNYTCHKCRQKGHWKQDCPMDSNNAGAAAITATAAIAAAQAAASTVVGHNRGGSSIYGPPPTQHTSSVGLVPTPSHTSSGLKRSRDDSSNGHPPQPSGSSGWSSMNNGGMLPRPSQPQQTSSSINESRDPRRRR